MEKKGQLTLFVIIAIVILIAGIVIFSIAPRSKGKSLDVNQISIFISDCLESESLTAIPEIAERGGYFLTPKFSTNTDIPIYHEGNKSLVPKKEFVEKELGEYLSQKVSFCTKNLIDFENEYEIESGKITTDVLIEREYVEFDLHYPLKIKKGELTVSLRDFNLRVDSKLGILYDSIAEFVKVSSGENCLSCVLEISIREDIYVDMFDNENNETIFIFRDKDYMVDNKEVLRYVFAEK